MNIGNSLADVNQSLESRKHWHLDLGARVLEDKQTTKFTVWAPHVSDMNLVVLNGDNDKNNFRIFQMESAENDYFKRTVEVGEGTKYFYLLDRKKKRADPVSGFQPEGVHGPTQVVDDSSFIWSDSNWKGLPMEDLIIYEVHVGTFTNEGTFSSLTSYIEYLVSELGVTAIELMPIAQFPGSRNWGYDGVFMFAPQHSYGGPLGLKNLVNSCHRKGLAVILDVVYNHVGPEGNYLQDFGPYFSDKYHTPWGSAFNYDDRGCNEVREYVINNAMYWIMDYHFDGLRLDAIHGIFDFSPKHILEDIKDSVNNLAKGLGREVNIIAESDLNDPKIVQPKEKCGYGLDAQWSDDFHHSIHAYLTGERFGYYQDFGSLEDIAKSLSDGFDYDGRYSVFRGRRHGKPSTDVSKKKFVIFLQNHDQVGNRPDGSRLLLLLKDKRLLKIAVGLLILSPYIPLLFMGEEFGETAPFYYFVSHTDPELIKAVREGRKKEFEAHNWGMEYVDPQIEETFVRSKINHSLRSSNNRSKELLSYYRQLLKLRKSHRALRNFEKSSISLSFDINEKVLLIRRRDEREELLVVSNLGPNKSEIDYVTDGINWSKILDSNGFSSASPTSCYSTFENETGSSPETLPLGSDQRILIPPFTLAVYNRQL